MGLRIELEGPWMAIREGAPCVTPLENNAHTAISRFVLLALF